LKGKIFYLYTGAFVGGILGQILIYGYVNDRSTFGYDKISMEDVPFLLILITGGAGTPIVILLSQLMMDRVKAIGWRFVVAIVVLGLSAPYGQYDSLFGHDALGYYSLWVTCIISALAALIIQKQRHLRQTK